jgi:pSer/pThr/pTyr-binding forkhead associated (FHA) protein
MKKFPDFVPPTKVAYLDRGPTLHLRKCMLQSVDDPGQEWSFDKEEIRLGSMDDNDIVLSDDTVSRYHCKIVQEDTGYVLIDLGSTNGTFINGEKITEGVVKPGQILRLGMVEMRFETSDAAAAAAASKKVHTLDQTRVIPQGVKLDELEGTRTPLDFGKSGFEKKDNKGTKTFITITVLIGILLLVALVWVLFKG